MNPVVVSVPGSASSEVPALYSISMVNNLIPGSNMQSYLDTSHIQVVVSHSLNFTLWQNGRRPSLPLKEVIQVNTVSHKSDE